MEFEDKLDRKLKDVSEAEIRPSAFVTGASSVIAVSVNPGDNERAVIRALEQEPSVNFVRINRLGEMTVYMSGSIQSNNVAVDRVSQALKRVAPEADEPVEPRIEDPRWPGSSMK